MNDRLNQDEIVALKKLIQRLGVEDALPNVVKDQLDTAENSNTCGIPVPKAAEFYNNNVDSEYFKLLQLILQKGRQKKNRTGVDTIGVFGAQAKFDVQMNAFPVLTTKKVFFRSIVHELLWFIRGDTNIKYLVDNDVHIWDEWAYKRYVDCNKINGKFEDDKWMRNNNDGTLSMFTQTEFIHRIKTDNKFTEKWGDLGKGTYGGMWRDFPADNIDPQGHHTLGVDQLSTAINKLRNNPDDRRIIVSAWHPYWVDHCALPPCHCMFHFNTEELTIEERHRIYMNAGVDDYRLLPKYLGTTDAESHKAYDDSGVPTRRLNCLLYQRSCDTFLGVPFNITSYSLLTAMIAHCVNMVPGTFTHTYGDLHLYVNHLDQVKEQLSRDSKILPKLWLNPKVNNLFAFKFEDIEVRGYVSHPAIKGDIAV